MTDLLQNELTEPVNQNESVPLHSTAPAERLHSLDVLRGIAMIVGLIVSIWIFGGFNTNRQNGLLLFSKGGNYRLWGAIELLFDGKMRALIALVFGAGILLFFSKPSLPGDTPRSDLFIRRQLWLMAFGLINAFLFLWQGDLLFHLGIMGIFLFPFARLTSKNLFVAALIFTIIFSVKNYWNYAEHRIAYSKYTEIVTVEKKISADSLAAAQKKGPVKGQKKDTLSSQQKEDKSAWEGILGDKKYDPKKNEDGYKDMRNGSFGKVWNYLVPAIQTKEAQWTYQTGIWDLAGMILLGMALFKAGFFSSGFSQQRYTLFALIGIAGGILLGWFRLQNNQYALQDYTRYITNHFLPYNLYFPFERALLAFGYASAVLLFATMKIFKWPLRAFALAGRMALSNYVLQSVVCGVFFTGAGMGYFGRLEQYQLYMFVMEVSIVQVVFSVLWLKHYHQGPAEWLLRSLVKKKWLPNKIDRNDITPKNGITISEISTI